MHSNAKMMARVPVLMCCGSIGLTENVGRYLPHLGKCLLVHNPPMRVGVGEFEPETVPGFIGLAIAMPGCFVQLLPHSRFTIGAHKSPDSKVTVNFSQLRAGVIGE